MAERSLNKLKKKDPNIQPIVIEGRTLVKSWWGKEWNNNMESYADFRNRISRGRSYVRNGAVIDLKIGKGKVTALVQGTSSKPYKVTVQIDELDRTKWENLTKVCNHQVASLEELMEGKFPKALELLFREKKYGLFPNPKEIHFDCSCPDWAYMCKHVAAVLYGIGTKLDLNPLLFFELRGVDTAELLRKSMESKIDSMLKNAGKKSSREIAVEEIFDTFGI
jgi:uncharacterized Zn finger protein